MKLIWIWLVVAPPVASAAQIAEWDSDQDAMPDGWELPRQLDIHDPADAWLDPDKDGICNLYEYFLGSDPQDRSQPSFLNYQGDQPLEEVLKTAKRGLVIRLPEGSHRLNYQYKNNTDPPRLMIQGGWNTDFSERDHCRYKTVLDGAQAGMVFDLPIASGSTAALVLDGLTLTNASTGAVRFTGYLEKAQLLLANCTLSSNTAHRASSIVQFEDANSTLISDLILVNTVIADNLGTGLRVVQRGSRTNFKILHCLVAFNAFSANDAPPVISGFGVNFRSEAKKPVHIQFANSIFWANANADLILSLNAGSEIQADNQQNIFGFADLQTAASLFPDPSNRSLDPLLLQAPDKRYYLDAASAAKGAGQDIGFTTGGQPDIGPVSCDAALATAIADDAPGAMLSRIYPNPAQDQLFLEGSFVQQQDVMIGIYDTAGKCVSVLEKGKETGRRQSWVIPIGALPAGLYFLVGHSGQGRFVRSFLKQN